MFRLLMVVFSFVIAGCAQATSVNALAEQGQWQALGQLDGQHGNYQRAPIELNQLSPADPQDVASYTQAYELALAEFCVPELAYEQGNSGREYAGECNGFANVEQIVLSWQDGLSDYELMEQVLGEFSD